MREAQRTPAVQRLKRQRDFAAAADFAVRRQETQAAGWTRIEVSYYTQDMVGEKKLWQSEFV